MHAHTIFCLKFSLISGTISKCKAMCCCLSFEKASTGVVIIYGEGGGLVNGGGGGQTKFYPYK
jgi:hypothetical protein